MVFQTKARQCCSWCGVVGGERGLLTPLGWHSIPVPFFGSVPASISDFVRVYMRVCVNDQFFVQEMTTFI